MQVTILRSDDRIVLDPSPPEVFDLLWPHLSYSGKVFYRGAELAQRRRLSLSPVEDYTRQCFDKDHRGRLATSYGFCDTIARVLSGAGYTVLRRYASRACEDKALALNATVYAPHWDRIDELVRDGFQFRPMQREALELIAAHELGRFDCPPAWGKGTLVRLACTLFPKAKIAVTTSRVDVLHQRLYPELAANLPSVGIVGGGKNVKGRRVICYTADSLHHAAGDEDIVFVDEGHEAVADKFATALACKFDHARLWGFSASWCPRADGKELRAEALFGPVRMRVGYGEAVDHGMIVPITILWSDVVMDVNPCGGMIDVDKKRHGIWSNEHRNGLVARDARAYADGVQVLVVVETIEHALRLKQLLPEFEMVYAGQSLDYPSLRYFRREGLIDESFSAMTEDRRRRLTTRFERGKLLKAIATSVWNVGVDFRQLQVLVRADGAGSRINDTQIPGRTSRLFAGKACGVVHDYRDQFDVGFRAKARGREKSYKQSGWTQLSTVAGQSKLQCLLRGDT